MTNQNNGDGIPPPNSIIEVTTAFISADYRRKIADMARNRAVLVMSEERWEEIRSSRRDAISADLEMIFSDPADFIGGAP